VKITKKTANIRQNVILYYLSIEKLRWCILPSTRCFPCRICLSATPILRTCRLVIRFA